MSAVAAFADHACVLDQPLERFVDREHTRVALRERRLHQEQQAHIRLIRNVHEGITEVGRHVEGVRDVHEVSAGTSIKDRVAFQKDRRRVSQDALHTVAWACRVFAFGNVGNGISVLDDAATVRDLLYERGQQRVETVIEITQFLLACLAVPEGIVPLQLVGKTEVFQKCDQGTVGFSDVMRKKLDVFGPES